MVHGVVQVLYHVSARVHMSLSVCVCVCGLCTSMYVCVWSVCVSRWCQLCATLTASSTWYTVTLQPGISSSLRTTTSNSPTLVEHALYTTTTTRQPGQRWSLSSGLHRRSFSSPATQLGLICGRPEWSCGRYWLEVRDLTVTCQPSRLCCMCWTEADWNALKTVHNASIVWWRAAGDVVPQTDRRVLN